MELHHIRCGDGVAIVDSSTGIPAVVHLGADPGTLTAETEAWLHPPVPPASLDATPPPLLVSLGDPARRSGLAAHAIDGSYRLRAGAFETLHVLALPDDAGPGMSFAVSDGTLRLEGMVQAGPVLSIRLRVENVGAVPVVISRLQPTLPLPADAAELLTLDGRWTREFHARRRPWLGGTEVIENRRGKTSHDRVPVGFAGTAGFGEHRGEVAGVHVAWSGNSEVRFDAPLDGRRHVQAGELLLDDEIVLGPGEPYDAPAVLLTWTDRGLTAASRHFHAAARQRTPTSPRPVLLNTWEAVYFDHDADRLRALAEVAASVGVERFVLDDGWFGSRRHDRAGLGDWWVSPEAHPDGLAPLIDHVRALGMEFGIWVEPEMVNPDSDCFRAHPEWVLGDASVTGRNQLVLDLANGECWTFLFDRLDALLSDHDIAFVKWDHNRDHVDAGAARQTRAFYGLLDALRSAHPTVEFESCASGGGRIDHGVLARCDRFWTSDCNDPLERQRIQHGFSLFMPPEVMGAHIGPPRAHTTGRSQRLHFRAATALFGHLGIEWNLLESSEADRAKLRAWLEVHKRLRPLLHGGDVVRLDLADPSMIGHGVVAPDRRSAVFSLAQLTTSPHTVPPRVRLAGLDPDARYEVTHLAVPGEVLGLALPPGWVTEPVSLTGRALHAVGIQPPLLHPESAILFELTAT